MTPPFDLDAYNDWRREHPTRPLPRDIEEQIVAEVTRLRLDVRGLRDVLEWVNVQCPGPCAGVCDAALRVEHRVGSEP